MTINPLIKFFLFGIFSLILFGCNAPPKVPLFLYPNISQVEIEKITLAPVIDRRSDRTYQFNVIEKIVEPAKKTLKEKGYQIIVTHGLNYKDLPATLTDIAEMNDKELLSLIPKDTDSLALVYLEDIRSGWGIRLIMPKYEFSVELTGVIISKNKGVLWRDKAYSARIGAGLLDAALTEVFEQGAFEEAVKLLFVTFPSK